jgi:hypothetical protein
MERNIAFIQLMIDTTLDLAGQENQRIDPERFLLETAARALATAVLGHHADPEYSIHVIAARAADLVAQGPLPESPLQAWADRGEWWRLIGWFWDEDEQANSDSSRSENQQDRPHDR